jgi:Ca-activated chloride channel family protein
MLLEERGRNPDAKLMLFVLTDGETMQGMSFDDMLPVIQALKVPVYTIGYDADIETLRRLSSIVEAASINANEGQIAYKIGSMLNAQM